MAWTKVSKWVGSSDWKIIKNQGGGHDEVTSKIHLKPSFQSNIILNSGSFFPWFQSARPNLIYSSSTNTLTPPSYSTKRPCARAPAASEGTAGFPSTVSSSQKRPCHWRSHPGPVALRVLLAVFQLEVVCLSKSPSFLSLLTSLWCRLAPTDLWRISQRQLIKPRAQAQHWN